MHTDSHYSMAPDDRLYPEEDAMARMVRASVSEFRKLAGKVEELTKECNTLREEKMELEMEKVRLENENEVLKARREWELHSGRYCTGPPSNEALRPTFSDREARQEAEIEQLRRENEELKARLNDPLLCGDEEELDEAFTIKMENKPILAFIWRLMKLDGATLKRRGDVKIVNLILHLITGLPLNSCKKVWEVGVRPFTRKIEDIDKFNRLMKSIGMKMQL